MLIEDLQEHHSDASGLADKLNKIKNGKLFQTVKGLVGKKPQNQSGGGSNSGSNSGSGYTQPAPAPIPQPTTSHTWIYVVGGIVLAGAIGFGIYEAVKKKK